MLSNCEVVRGGERVELGVTGALTAMRGRDESLAEGVALPSECWHCMMRGEYKSQGERYSGLNERDVDRPDTRR